MGSFAMSSLAATTRALASYDRNVRLAISGSLKDMGFRGHGRLQYDEHGRIARACVQAGVLKYSQLYPGELEPATEEIRNDFQCMVIQNDGFPAFDHGAA